MPNDFAELNITLRRTGNRVVQQKSTNLLGGSEVEYYAYSFTGNPTKKQKVHTATGKADITENYTYDYDHANRPTTTTYQLGSNTAITLSLLTYDELGRVKEKKLHGTKETINYTYNIWNWLKGINSANFKETLYYQDGSTPLYNGNISRLSWQSVNSSEMQSYQFTYDPLNRLTNTSYTPSASRSAYAKESLMYDKMGNIKALRRTRHTASGTSFTLIPFDNLTLAYTGNQLKKITDASDPSEGFIKPTGTAPTIEYGYNKNGAMTSDFNRNITNIRYNVLNLPDTILFKAGHSTRYSYDAAGMKRRTIHTTVVSKVATKLSTETASNMGTTNSLGTTSSMGSTNSVGGTATLNPPTQVSLADADITDYCGNIIYENGALKYILTPEGYVTKSGSTIIYNYYLRDHLGNNRVVMAVNGNNYTAVQKTDYYPFGMPFENGLAPEKQPYKFGGKELDEMHGLNTYDQGARQFGAVRYSTDTMDPMLEKYYSTSPYCQMGNNPVNYIDPTGMDYYMLTSDGRTVLALKNNDDYDRLYNSYTDNYGYTSISGKYTQVNDQSLLPQLAGSGDLSSAVTSNSNDAFNVFKFAVDNSNVEWSLAGFKNSAGNTDFTLNTTYDERSVKSRNLFGNERSDMIFDVHSHPGTEDYTKTASGYDLYFNNLSDGGSDAEFMNTYFNAAKDANKKWPSEYPKLFIYHKETGGLYHYNHKTSSKYAGQVTTPISMRTLIRNYKIMP